MLTDGRGGGIPNRRACAKTTVRHTLQKIVIEIVHIWWR